MLKLRGKPPKVSNGVGSLSFSDSQKVFRERDHIVCQQVDFDEKVEQKARRDPGWSRGTNR